MITTERFMRPHKVLENGNKVLEIHERIKTRKLDRMVAKNRMKNSGIRKATRQGRSNLRSGVGRGVLESNKRGDSVFSSEWRKYTG